MRGPPRGEALAHVVRLFPWLLAIGGGAGWAACFARQPLGVATWGALVPLVLLLRHRGSIGFGFLHGLVAWLLSIYWIAPTLEVYGNLDRWASWLLLLLLAAYLALYHAAFAWVGRSLIERGVWLSLGTLPALWVVLEWIRGHLMGGFPWNLAAYAWVEMPGALPLSAWVGAHGVSFLLLLANSGLALAALRRDWLPAAVGLLVPLLFLAVGGRWAVPAASAVGQSTPVRIVQPNIANLETWDSEVVNENYAKLLALSHEACDRSGALVIWPESAAWPYSLSRHDVLRQDVEELVDRGCSLILNSPHPAGPGRVYNSAFLLEPSGEIGRYDKRHLVPFGEYVPLADLFPFLPRVARGAGDFSAAQELVLLPWRGEHLGMAICFEVIFPGEVAQMARQGGSVLVTITNDAWYGDTSAPWQHFRAARFRAAENRRPLLRAAITGVSAVVEADGGVASRLGVDREGILRARIRGRRGVGLYSRYPWGIPLLCGVGTAFAILRARRS